MPKVSILMNCYNGEKFVRESIESVYAQTYSDWEIIFIDNVSTDSTPQIAKSFDSRIKYYRTPQFMKLCEARVWARPYIHGNYFAVLDSDDLWLPTKLEKQVRVFEERPEVGIVYTNTLFFDDKGHEVPYYNSPQPNGNLFDPLLATFFFSLETLMARKSVMDEHNIYFSPQYNIASDAEMFLKLSYYTQCHYIDEVLAKWRYGHSSESVKQYFSFPQEYEFLIEELKAMIPNFERDHQPSLSVLRTRIQNMYGLAHWKEGDLPKARSFFKEALKHDFKYALPWAMTYLGSFDTYKHVRGLFRKV